MTALVCIDTHSRRVRRYEPRVLMGARWAKCTHEAFIEPPQQETIAAAIEAFRKTEK